MDNKKQQKISPTKQRILQYIEYVGVSKEEFCRRISLDSSNLRGVGLNSEPSCDKIANILREFHDVNPVWLITGSGPMILCDFTENDVNTNLNIQLDILNELREIRKLLDTICIH